MGKRNHSNKSMHPYWLCIVLTLFALLIPKQVMAGDDSWTKGDDGLWYFTHTWYYYYGKEFASITISCSDADINNSGIRSYIVTDLELFAYYTYNYNTSIDGKSISYSLNNSSNYTTLAEGDAISLTSSDELHLRFTYQNQKLQNNTWYWTGQESHSNYPGRYDDDIISPDIGSFSLSTSEFYKNYFYSYDDRTAEYFINAGDATILLDNTWGNSSNYSVITDGHNWNPDENKYYHINNEVRQTIQSINSTSKVLAGPYTLQAIVRAPEGQVITMTLNGKSSQVVGTGTNATSPSSVNTFGRVDSLNLNTTNGYGWIKLEKTITGIEENGTIDVVISSTGGFDMSDVVLLWRANQDGYYWTTANGHGTYFDMSDMSKYNMYSFFDRGNDNLNRVIKANQNAVIGMTVETAPDAKDHRHTCNVVSPENGNDVCKLLYLYADYKDNSSTTTMRKGGYAFGIEDYSASTFTATSVKIKRSMTTNVWTSMYLPYPITSGEMGSTLYTFKSTNDDNTEAVFDDVNEVAANTAFAFKPTNSNPVISIENCNKTVSKVSSTSPTGLLGNYEAISSDLMNQNTDEYEYYLFSASQDKLTKAKSTGAYLLPFRAYLKKSKTANASTNTGAKVFSLSFIDDDIIDLTTPVYNNPSESSRVIPEAKEKIALDDYSGIATNIQEVGIVDEKEQTIYNMNGEILGNDIRNLPKGIYIQNGRKVVIR